MECGCCPLAIFGIVPKQILAGTNIFVISASNLEHSFVKHDMTWII